MNLEDYNKYYIQGSDHYLIPKDEFKELFNEMINWKEESQRQKEAINNIKKLVIEYLEHDYSTYYENEIEVELINDISNILKEVSE